MRDELPKLRLERSAGRVTAIVDCPDSVIAIELFDALIKRARATWLAANLEVVDDGDRL